MDNFREWLSDNLRYILLGLAACLVVIIIICVVKLAGGSSSRKEEPAASGNKVTELAEASSEAEGTASGSAAPESTSSLKKDDPAILELVKKYYTAVAAGDTATLATIVDPWNDKIEEGILANTLVESYDNISTYSKAGPVDGSYIVYAYYDGKIKDISTGAPSLALLYVVTNDAGELVVGDRYSSSEVSDFIKEATAAGDVQALKNDVNQKLYDAEAADPALKEFIEGQGTAAEETEGEGASASAGTDNSTGSGDTATTTAGVNIRAEASPDASIVIVTYQGAEVNVIERGDEWTHVTFVYDGATYEGYISTQYLDFGDSSSADSGDTSASGTSGDAASQDADTTL